MTTGDDIDEIQDEKDYRNRFHQPVVSQNRTVAGFKCKFAQKRNGNESDHQR